MLRRAGKCGLILKKQNNVSAHLISKERLHGIRLSGLVAERYACHATAHHQFQLITSSTLNASEV